MLILNILDNLKFVKLAFEKNYVKKLVNYNPHYIQYKLVIFAKLNLLN